ncbi:MAG: hypothetical protein ABI579_01210 [Candidatus Sumerlaeota bacterium]
MALFLANVLIFALFFGGAFLLAELTMPILSILHPLPQVHAAAAIFVLFTSTIFAVWFSATGYFGELVSREKYPGLRQLLQGVRRDFFFQWQYLVVCMSIIAVLMINIWFYSFSGMLAASAFVRYLLSGFCFWIIILVLTSMIVGLPMRSRERTNLKQTFKRGMITLMRSPLIMIGLLIFIASLWIIAAWLRFAPIFLFGFSGTAMLMNSFYDVAFGVDALSEQTTAEKESAAATSWKQKQGLESEAEQLRMSRSRYERTLRDLLRPWEG